MGLVPGQTATAQLGQWWHLSAGSLLSGPRLARENAALKARVLDLAAQNKDLLTAQAENVRLRRLLGFEQRSPRAPCWPRRSSRSSPTPTPTRSP